MKTFLRKHAFTVALIWANALTVALALVVGPYLPVAGVVALTLVAWPVLAGISCTVAFLATEPAPIRSRMPAPPSGRGVRRSPVVRIGTAPSEDN